MIRILFLALTCLLLSPATMAAETRNVLVLFSSTRLLPANIEADRGLRETIGNTSDRPVELYAEFLDVPRFGGEAYVRTVATYLREKYAARPPDLIVAGGEDAFDFLLRNRAQLFPHVPVVHMAITNSFLRSMPPLPVDVVGVPIEYEFSGTIEQALRWHPQARRLVLVTGTAVQDREWEARLRAEVPRFEDRATVEFLAGLSTAAVLKRLGELGEDAVVFTPGYFQDGENRIFNPRASVEMMAAASGAPMYGPFNTFIGTGVIGGRMPTFESMGRHAAQIVNALLGGAAPASLGLPKIMPTVVHVDWRAARRWGIDEKDVPGDAIVHFKTPTFWEAYRNVAIITIAVILVQIGLIAALLVQRRLRRRTAAALEESEQRMNLAARAAELSMWIWDVARDRVWLTPTAPSRQPVGLANRRPIDFSDVLDAVHPADREELERAARQALAKDADLDIEYRMLRPGGEVRWIAARGRADKKDGQRLLGVALDITKRKQAELQAEQDRSALLHMTRVSVLGQLSASIAHELNQPLAAILGNAEAAQKMLGRERVDLAELREICADIVSEDHRAAAVIGRLRSLFKRGELTVQPLDANELIRETLDLVRTNLLTRHVTPVTQLAPSLPAIDGDRVQLQQVLLNLIMNAADAMNTTEREQRKLTIRTDVTGGVRVCVTDVGPGIAPEDLKNVFDPFWSTKPGGMGIGLAICRSIVAAHRGTLTVANNSNGGATFCATLPARGET